MKKCAKCDTEYDDAYDACPSCTAAKGKSDKAAVGCMAIACGPMMLVWVIIVVVVMGGLAFALLK